MPFIRKGGAFKLLNAMETGSCAGSCRSLWLSRIQYALKAKSNPLDLTTAEKRTMTRKVAQVKHNKPNVTRKSTRIFGMLRYLEKRTRTKTITMKILNKLRKNINKDTSLTGLEKTKIESRIKQIRNKTQR